MSKLSWPLAALVAFVLAGCVGGAQSESEFSSSPLAPGNTVEETPPPERVSDLLQEAKQQYDDGHYVTALRMGEQAVALIEEFGFPDSDMALAITIQGFSLLQIGRIDDYFVTDHGMQIGAISKFEAALKVRPTDFRAQLGIGLAQFRRHGDHIRKAEVLGEGITLLESIRHDFRNGAAAVGTTKGNEQLRDASRKFKTFLTNRAKLVELTYIFRDPSTIKMAADGVGPEAEWLGNGLESDDAVLVNDMGWILDDAIAGEALKPGDIQVFDRAAVATRDSWQKVRRYWRLRGLKDLQSARDRFLEVRKLDTAIAASSDRMEYFWVDRDLSFVFQSLGAFFLDGGLETARLQAISEGVAERAIESRAREIYLSDDFNSRDKVESQRNYAVALGYIENFVKRHRLFEDMRRRRTTSASQTDDVSNPFMVDLVARYRATMDELIQEERSMRKLMILEAAALCIDPLFQVNDIDKANLWANEIKALDPSSPIHHFVSATAYYANEDWELALDSYTAFMNASSITEDSNRRTHARTRIFHCEQQLRRSAGAGEADGVGNGR